MVMRFQTFYEHFRIDATVWLKMVPTFDVDCIVRWYDPTEGHHDVFKHFMNEFYERV